jgi:amino acid permease
LSEELAMIDDEKLGELLRSDAPPTRDAMFRLSVLERRERQRYQRKSVILAASAIMLAVVLWVGFNAADRIATFFVAALCIALAGACVLSVPGVLQLVRRLRDVRAASGKN